MIIHSHRLATRYSALASTGIIRAAPGSTNTVPGQVNFSLDIRAGEDACLMSLEEHLKVDFERIARGETVDELNEGGTTGQGCAVEWTLDAPSTAVRFHRQCINSVIASSQDLFGEQTSRFTQNMISGAGKYYLRASPRRSSAEFKSGHDSVFTSRRSPTSMIFVPCRKGISHNPNEYCAPEDCANGAQVLMGAVLRYDLIRAAAAGCSR